MAGKKAETQATTTALPPRGTTWHAFNVDDNEFIGSFPTLAAAEKHILENLNWSYETYEEPNFWGDTIELHFDRDDVDPKVYIVPDWDIDMLSKQIAKLQERTLSDMERSRLEQQAALMERFPVKPVAAKSTRRNR